MRAARRAIPAALVLALAATAGGAPEPPSGPAPRSLRVLVDDFEDVAKWTAHPADGVELVIGSDAGVNGRSLRLDFAFSGGGYAVARRVVALDLPENYRFRFAVRGRCPPNDLEFKLVDESGDNVWWHNRRGFRFPPEWDSLSTRKRHVSFAWGPAGGEIRRVAAIEFAITAGSGGRGSVWIDDLTLEALPPPDASPPALRASASSGRPGHDAGAATDGEPATHWASAPGDREPWLALDLGGEREFGGLVIDWEPGRHLRDYAVETSRDGVAWRTAREVRRGNGGRDPLYLPETEAAHVRVRAVGPAPARCAAAREIAIRPLAYGGSLESFFGEIAGDAPRGSFPRGISGEPSVWAVVGLDGDSEEALLGGDGALETGRARFSIEPFLLLDGRLVSWADVRIGRRLEGGHLPIPTVTWEHGDLALSITAFAVPGMPGRAPAAGGSGVVARYRVRNSGRDRRRPTLVLALRPFQVNPPSQSLNVRGGTAPIREIAREGPVVRVDGDRGVACLTPPSGFGAAAFDEGDVVEFLRRGRLPPRARVADPFGHASGALTYRLDLAPGAVRDVRVFVPLHASPAAPGSVGAAALARAEEACEAWWAARTAGVEIELPEAAADVARTLRAQLGWILVNRDGPAIQPGSRAYERSWIRDGSLTSSALLRLGRADVVREFVDWFARFQYPDGKVPCCVDRRGADPVPEHDSAGEFVYLVAEYHRHTGDRERAEALWPAVAGAVAYLDSLRGQRRTDAWRAPGREAFFGILPPSISHEGYSAKPMHSYWDDFFALRGFKDAAYLAGALGREADRDRLAAIRDEFARELAASIRAAMAMHGIDYVPGCADLGDFDATSTAIALSPVDAGEILPPAALRRTFERYWEFFRERRDGGAGWENFTPYEIRNIGAFVRLGWRERAEELLRFFMDHRSPSEWAQWAEVVWRDPGTPRFIGDLPHTWVGSDFVRSVLDMLAFERERDDALVLGAGIPLSWVADDPGVTVRRLATPRGPLGFHMRLAGDELQARIEDGVRIPEGGIVVSPPARRPYRRATVNGRPAALSEAGEVVVRELPADVRLRP